MDHPAQEAMNELRAAIREEIQTVVRSMLPELKQAVYEDLATRIEAAALTQGGDGFIANFMKIIGKTIRKAAAAPSPIATTAPAAAVSPAEGQPTP